MVSMDWLGILVVLMLFGLVLAFAMTLYFSWRRFVLASENKVLRKDFNSHVDQLVEKKTSSEKPSH